ncbi:hypothetical protein N0V86_004478 [Didymella sp. IMI 355093]|nr:hypothetical protein N0V86_004478 [Didymella sp. IMI 355093]
MAMDVPKALYTLRMLVPTSAPAERPAENKPTSPFVFAPEPACKKQKSDPKSSSSKVISLLPESDESLQISVRLHSRFDVFPDVLRNTVECMHRAAYIAYMADVNIESHPAQKLTYSVVKGQRLSPYNESDFVFTTHKVDFENLSVVNMWLLESFWNHNKHNLDGADFAKLEIAGVENPAMLWLYSVRPHEIGWALNKNERLSSCATKVEDDKLHHRVAFVECKVVKVGGEAQGLGVDEVGNRSP